MKKEKILTISLIFITVILAVLAILTAWKIATREPVAPSVPQGEPEAVESNPACKLSFSVSLPVSPTPTGEVSLTPMPTGSIVLTPTPTGTLIPTQTPTPPPDAAPTPTPLLGCYRDCESDDDCEGTLRCQTISGVKRCVDLTCPGEKDCICNVDCWGICGQDRECPDELVCQSIDEVHRCVHPDCERENDCECGSPTGLTATPGLVSAGPTPTGVELPEAGISLPTVGAVLGGIILTVISLLLVL